MGCRTAKEAVDGAIRWHCLQDRGFCMRLHQGRTRLDETIAVGRGAFDCLWPGTLATATKSRKSVAAEMRRRGIAYSDVVGNWLG